MKNHTTVSMELRSKTDFSTGLSIRIHCGVIRLVWAERKKYTYMKKCEVVDKHNDKNISNSRNKTLLCLTEHHSSHIYSLHSFNIISQKRKRKKKITYGAILACCVLQIF